LNRKIGVVSIWHGLLYIIVISGAITMIFPLLWLLSTSFKTYDKTLHWPPELIPNPFYPRNYADVLSIPLFARAILNSAIYAIFGMLGTVFLASLAGFAFAKYEFPGKNLLFFLILSTLMIPGQVTLIPNFLILKTLGWLNTFLALIVPGLGAPFGIFLIRQFALGIPSELFDSARVDGASEFRIYWQIFLPLCIPAISTLAVLEFLGRWNDLFWPIIVTRTPEMRTVQMALTLVCRTLYDIIWNQLAAGMVLAFLPVFILFVIFQKYFVEGIALTGLKG
jgi:multiple sugar transport system permease protein